jgi:hypothetical protein
MHQRLSGGKVRHYGGQDIRDKGVWYSVWHGNCRGKVRHCDWPDFLRDGLHGR